MTENDEVLNPFKDRIFLSAGDEFGPDKAITFKKNRVIPKPERIENKQIDIPSGLICMWSGSISGIPSGWYLCDGSNGTPDLRDRFIKGAGSGVGAGAMGGSSNHSHANHANLSHANHSHDSHTGLTHADHNHDTHSGSFTHSNETLSHSAPTTGVATGTDKTVVTSVGNHTGHTHDDHSYSLTHSSESIGSHGTLSHSQEAIAAHSINAHSTANHEPLYYAVLFIMKA